jgi:hypothetical protein
LPEDLDMKGGRLRGAWLVGLAGAATLLLVLLLGRPLPRGVPRFRDVRELQGWAEGHGLYCRSDREDGRVVGGLAISTRPLAWGEMVALCKRDRQCGTRWVGVVWALDRSPGLDEMPAPPWDGECRLWGGVLVTGDPALLDRIEEAWGTAEAGVPCRRACRTSRFCRRQGGR